jgi:hypothetical protein
MPNTDTRNALRGAAALLALLAAQAAAAGPSIYPTGVTRYDPNGAYNGFVVFGGADRKTHVIDMDGNEVHGWPYAGQPSVVLDPQLTGGRRGDVLVQLAEVAGSPHFCFQK